MSRAVIASVALACFAIGCSRCQPKSTSQGQSSRAPAAPHAASAPPAAQAPAPPTLPPIPTTPLTADETSTCDVQTDVLKRATCLSALAQRHRDPRYCGAMVEITKAAGEEAPQILRSGTAADACFRNIAYMRNAPELCNRISQPSMTGSCLSRFASGRGDSNLCAIGEGESQAICFLNEAARTRDVELCPKTGKFQEDCTKRLGPQAPPAP